jgi:hypothetical protein
MSRKKARTRKPAKAAATKIVATNGSSAVSALTFADHHSLVDEEFLVKVADILERLRTQSELRGHPLLASLLAITRQEAEDDLRTRVGEYRNGGLLGAADESMIRIAQRFSCGPRPEAPPSQPKNAAEALFS